MSVSHNIILENIMVSDGLLSFSIVYVLVLLLITKDTINIFKDKFQVELCSLASSF